SPTFSYVGNSLEARRRAEEALRLSPFDPFVFFTHCALGLAAYTEGDYSTAIAWGRRSYAENPNYTANLRFLTASLAAAQRIDEARQIGDSITRMEPGFRVGEFCERYAYSDPSLRTRLAQHLVAAGLPE